MPRRVLLAVGLVLMLLAVGVWTANGQGGGDKKDQFTEVPIVTTATNSVGLGTYVAAEAYGVAAGDDPTKQPAVAIILPYGIDPDMKVEKIEDFVQPKPAIEGFTFAWSLSKIPDGSKAALVTGTESATVALFMADIEGQYDLTLTLTDPKGNTGTATWSVFATTYVGVGGLTGSAPAFPQCGTCHADKGKAWFGTNHASMFTRAIDGKVSSHYAADCVVCHTTGFNNRPEAVNGGFDDVVRDAGWTFPTELKDGNWDALVQQFPQVAAMANIQCESCHGPGNLHTKGNIAAIGFGLNYGTCAQCHAEGPYHIFPQQWEQSPHAVKNAQAFTYPIGEDHQACVRCHSGYGFIDYVQGKPQDQWRTDYQVITCAVCHDPHDAKNPNQLRVFDTITLPDGTEVKSAGPAATCMTCHNDRIDPVASVEGVAQGKNFSTPHYSNAAELINSTGGYTWGAKLPTSPHGRIIDDTCVGCHMAATPGIDDNGTPNDTSDDKPLPGHNTVGQHTFSMVSAVDGTENVTVCQTCHDVTSFEFDAFRDYDGNGTIDTNQKEVEGLMALLQKALEDKGVKFLDSYPYFQIPDGADVNVYGAIYNWKFAGDKGASVHNLRYIVSLLQLSYEKLTGQPVPNAYILKPKS